MLSLRQQRTFIGILAVTQVISWGAIYYAFSILAPEIQRELGWRAETVFGAFSWSLLVAGLVSTPIGILLDRFGGRYVMGTGSTIAGMGLLLLGVTQSVLVYFVAWTILGIAMALVLYEAAFAAINREFIAHTRKAISILTLFGGFASTVFWPITLFLNAHLGWRDTYLIYGIMQLAVCLPAHLMLHTRRPDWHRHANLHTDHAKNYTLKEAIKHPAFWKLAFAFATNAFIFSALSVHLIPLMHRMGHAMASAVFFAVLIGPMQVLGRIGEMAFAHRTHPQTVGKITFAILPAALLVLWALGEHQWAIALFCALYGLSNGILTIVRGTIPRELFGAKNYGAISGALSGPALIAKAAGPLGVAALIGMDVSPNWLLGSFLAVAVLSFGCYLAAVGSRHDTRVNGAKNVME
jgi:MFS family permease